MIFLRFTGSISLATSSAAKASAVTTKALAHFCSCTFVGVTSFRLCIFVTFLLMYLPGAALHCGLYEVFKRLFPFVGNSLSSGGGTSATSSSPFLSEQMASAAAAATITSCIMNPMDIIKTRIQSSETLPQYERLLPPAIQRQPFLSRSVIVNEFFHLIQKEGAAALVKGLLPRLLTTIPVIVASEVALSSALKSKVPVDAVAAVKP